MKVADVGVAKHENEITGTVCGTSLYLAPEVFESGIYNSKADMYSFGYVLWELWYGETAFGATIDSKTEYKVLEDMVKQDLRPTHIEGTHLPLESWQHVMVSCWNKDPKLRLTAEKGWEQLQKPPPRPPKSSALSTPPLPQTSSSRGPPPQTKPKPATRPKKPKGIPVSFHRETEEEMVHFK